MLRARTAPAVEAGAALLSRVAVLVGLVGFAVVGLVGAEPAAPWVLAVAAAGFVLGVPHGALDHLLVARIAGRSVLLTTSLYALAAAAAWAALRWGGAPVQWAVLALSVAHFGAGELEVWRTATGWRPGRATAAALAVAGTGALLLPLARGGEDLAGVAAAFSGSVAAVLAEPAFRVALVVVWGAAALVAAVAALRVRARAVVVDVVLVGLLGALAPPLVAFALWFGTWHAVRHSGRLLVTDPTCARLVAAGRPSAAVARLARDAALPTAVALVALAALVSVTAAAPAPAAALAEVLRVLLALTVPHVLAVAWLDHRGRRSGRSGERGGRGGRGGPLPPARSRDTSGRPVHTARTV